MREQDLPFFRLAMNYSLRWAEHFRERQLAPEARAQFEAETRRSLSAYRCPVCPCLLFSTPPHPPTRTPPACYTRLCRLLACGGGVPLAYGED